MTDGVRPAGLLDDGWPADPAHGTPTWFGTSSLPPAPPVRPRARRASRSDPDRAGFERLWKSFMSARVLLALAVLALLLSAHVLSQPLPAWMFGLSSGYIVLTAAQRLWVRPLGPGRAFDAQWLYTVGLDLLYIGLLLMQQVSGVHYTPLLALPVLMAAILGSRPLALGTAALAALTLLGDAVIGARATLWASTADVAQAGLMGAGLLALAWLTNTLSVRLAREQQLTRRSRAEVRMQSLVNNLVIETLAEGVLVVDEAYTVRAANPAAHVMLGSDEEVTPSVFRLTDHPSWVQLADIARLTLAGEVVDSTEITLYHEEQPSSQLRVRTERTPSTGEGDTPLCVMFLQDLREMEAQLRTEKLAAMGRMSAAVAHEIRNPLAAISQANALLAEELDAPAARRLTDMIGQNAQRLAHIVDDVLDVARAQGNERDGQAVPLNDETADVCAEWEAQQGAGERLQVYLLAVEPQVQFAREHLRRLLVNLLDNAARYASGHRGAIQVATQSIRHGPAVLRVWSDGAPLEPSVQRHLFEPFFSSESRSSGLGLFICRELCERHGASIGYERSARERDGQAIEGNEFFIHFRRAPGGHSSWNLEELTAP